MTMKTKLLDLITNEINPQLARHRGGCELVSVDDNTASIRLTGSCTGCPGKIHTFNKNIIPFLLANVEGLKAVDIVK